MLNKYSGQGNQLNRSKEWSEEKNRKEEGRRRGVLWG
jgi:hypothetical protein